MGSTKSTNSFSQSGRPAAHRPPRPGARSSVCACRSASDERRIPSKPRMKLPSALALGIAGMEEVAEMELAEDCPDHEILLRLSAPRLAWTSSARFSRMASRRPDSQQHVPDRAPPDRLAEAEAKTAEPRRRDVFRRPAARRLRPVDVCARWSTWASSRQADDPPGGPRPGRASPRDVLVRSADRSGTRRLLPDAYRCGVAAVTVPTARHTGDPASAATNRTRRMPGKKANS